MTEEDPGRSSRRTLLKSVTALGGAAALGMGSGAAGPAASAASAAGPTPDDLVPDGSGLDPGRGTMAWSPPLQQHTIGQFEFQPIDLDAGRRVSTTGAYPAHADTYMVAPVHLPVSSVITDVRFFGYNNSGAQRTFKLERAGLSSYSFTDVTSMQMPTSPSLQFVGNSANHVVGPDHSYNVSVYCFASGSLRVLSARISYRGPYGYFPLAPQVRRLDTRNAGIDSGKIVASGTKPVHISPLAPTTATSVVMNLTVTDTEGAGWLSAYPAGFDWPGTSSLNWSGPGQTVANSVTVGIGTGTTVELRCGGAGAKAHVIADVIGYYA